MFLFFLVFRKTHAHAHTTHAHATRSRTHTPHAHTPHTAHWATHGRRMGGGGGPRIPSLCTSGSLAPSPFRAGATHAVSRVPFSVSAVRALSLWVASQGVLSQLPLSSDPSLVVALLSCSSHSHRSGSDVKLGHDAWTPLGPLSAPNTRASEL